MFVAYYTKIANTGLRILAMYDSSAAGEFTVIFFSAISFSSDFDRGTYSLNKSKQKISAEKILQTPPQHLHYEVKTDPSGTFSLIILLIV